MVWFRDLGVLSVCPQTPRAPIVARLARFPPISSAPRRLRRALEAGRVGRGLALRRRPSPPRLEDQVKRGLGSAPEVREAGFSEDLGESRFARLGTKDEMATVGDGVGATE